MNLPDLDAARTEAIRRIRVIIAKEGRTGPVNIERSYDIMDEKGRVILTLPFAAALD